MQGLCTNKINKDCGVILSKAVLTVNKNKLIPLKVFNYTNETVHLNKGQILADFELFDKDHVLQSVSEGDNHYVQNVQMSSNDTCMSSDEKIYS